MAVTKYNFITLLAIRSHAPHIAIPLLVRGEALSKRMLLHKLQKYFAKKFGASYNYTSVTYQIVLVCWRSIIGHVYELSDDNFVG